MPLDLQQFEAVSITVNVEEIKNRFTVDQEERQQQCSKNYRDRVADYKAMKQAQDKGTEKSIAYSSSAAAVYSSLGESQLNRNGNGLNSHNTDDHHCPEAESESAAKRQKFDITTASISDLNTEINDRSSVLNFLLQLGLMIANFVNLLLQSCYLGIVSL